MSTTRTSRYLPIRAKIVECEAALESIHETNRKVNQLISLERLIAFKRNIEIKNI